MDSLIITNLTKQYPNGVVALDEVSLEVPVGLFGLLGPNGAGKSSLLRTIATLQSVDSGSIRLGELDVLANPLAVRKQLGYLPQEFGLYPRLSAEVMLDHLAVLKGFSNRRERKDRVAAMLSLTNLYSSRKQRLGTFSGGMKQRFGIAQALLANPRLLIVDEPTAGLDPSERNRFHNLLSQVAEQTIVIYSTHIVDDVRELCTEMAIMANGRVLFQGSPTAGLRQLEGKIYEKQVRHEALPEYRSAFRVISEKLHHGQPVIHILSDVTPGYGFRRARPALEDVYFSQLYQAQGRREAVMS